MTEGLDVSGLRSESVVFRLELSDFGAFYKRTYDTVYRTALGITVQAEFTVVGVA